MGEVVRFTGNVAPAAAAGSGPPSLRDRLAALLTEIVDQPLLVLTDADAMPSVRTGQLPGLELRLAHFRPDLAERAADLLEEAGW